MLWENLNLMLLLLFLLSPGAMGFFACFWFVTKIYSVVKVDWRMPPQHGLIHTWLKWAGGLFLPSSSGTFSTVKLKGPLQSEPSPAPFQERILLPLADLTVFFVSVRACHIYSIFLNEIKHNCASLFLTSDAYKVDSYLAIFKSVTRFMFFSWCVHSVFAGVIGNHSQTNKAVRVCFSTAATTRFYDQLWTLDMSKEVNTVSHFFSHSCGTVFISLRGCGFQKLHVLKEAAIAIKQS